MGLQREYRSASPAQHESEQFETRVDVLFRNVQADSVAGAVAGPREPGGNNSSNEHRSPHGRLKEVTMITATMVVATVPVTDLERAKEFYGDTIGLTFLWETPVAVRYRCGSLSEISVFKRPPIATEHTLAHFEVDDI